MSFLGSNWKQTLIAYLPYIGGALGGPLAGVAIKAGLKAFGASDDDIKNSGNGLGMLKNLVLGATPDDIVTARASDEQFKTDMAKIGHSLEVLHQKDRASARSMAKSLGAAWQNAVGIFLIGSSVGIMIYIIVVGLRPDTNDFALLMLGNLQGWAGGYVVFLYGSSKGSKEKDTQISSLVKTVTGE